MSLIGSEIDGIEITKEMVEAVAISKIYREDSETALLKSTTQRFKKGQLQIVLNTILKSEDYKAIQDDVLATEEAGLIDDNLNTVMLQYNRLLKNAQAEGKYEVAARILKEIRAIKAIENEQTKFEVVIRVEEPSSQKDENNK